MATNVSSIVFQSGANAAAVTLINSDTLNLLVSGFVAATGTGASPGVRGHGSNTFNLAGDVLSFAHAGIETTSGGNILNIAATGTVFGHLTGIRIAGDGSSVISGGDIGSTGGAALNFTGESNTLVNSGYIRSTFTNAVVIGGNSSVTNSGRIEASNGDGVECNGSTNTVVNTWTLIGSHGVSFNSGGVNSLFNAGLLIGNSGAGVAGNNGQDLVLNNGLIEGESHAVALYEGNDVYDGRNGRVDGAIEGGAGNDVLYGGVNGEALDGGDDHDQISGGGGGDVIRGGAGNDLISGNVGGDVIRGGLGGDLIVFNVGDNGDLIQNFNEGGVRDGFDLRGYFNATGYTGTTPRAAGIMQVLQNGADTDVYLHGGFAFRIQGVAAAAIDDTYFLFQ